MIACVCSCNASRRTQGGIDRLMTFVLDELRERELSATGRRSRVVPMHFAVQFDDAHPDRVIALNDSSTTRVSKLQLEPGVHRANVMACSG